MYKFQPTIRKFSCIFLTLRKKYVRAYCIRASIFVPL